MSKEALAWAAEQPPTSPPTHKFVLLTLANHANRDDCLAYPKVSTLVKESGLHEDTVRAALASLVRDGVITDTGQRRGDTCQVRTYKFPDCCKAKANPKTRMVRGFDGHKARERPGGDPNGSGLPYIEGTKEPLNPQVVVAVAENPEGNSEGTSKGFTPKELSGACQGYALPALPDEAVLWNKVCGDVQRYRVLSEKDRRNLEVRRSDPFFREHYREALDKVSSLGCYRGELKSGWRATFSWLLEPDHFENVINAADDTRRMKENCL